MRVHQGRSFDLDAAVAVAGATAGWSDEPEMVFAFCSTAQDVGAVGDAVRARFPNARVAGCTTAGELLCGEHSNGSLVMAGVYDSTMRWATHLIRDVKTVDADRARAVVDDLLEQLGAERDSFDPDDYFALLVIDGLSMAEERVSALLAEALEGIRLAGGSAGDDLAFSKTCVLSDQGTDTDAAVLVLAHRGDAEVSFIKHQHFSTTPKSLCITKASPATRTVHEMDGYPAIEAYAAALGLSPECVTDEITFANPVTFSCDGEIYVRSIQKLNEDGSIVFYCGIEEGMVLEIGGHADITQALDQCMSDAAAGVPQFVLGFNCILRALEAKAAQAHDSLAEVYKRFSHAMIGFDTYGEQLNGLHINQTLMAVAITSRSGEEARSS